MQLSAEITRRWRGRPTRTVRAARTATAGVAVAVSAALALSACSSGNSANAQGLGQITTWAPGDRKPLPELSGATLGGGKLDVSTLKGHVIVINEWGSWCGSCQDEAPALEQVYEQNKAKGVDFVGINTRDGTDSPQANAFVKTADISYPSLIDGDAETLMVKFAGVVPLNTVPSTLIVDRDGKIAWRALTAIDAKELQAGLNTVLAEK